MTRLLPLLLLAGCSMPGAWRALPVLPATAADLVPGTRAVLEHEGYPVETEEPSDGSCRLLSKWIEALNPHWREGSRRRVDILMEPKDGGTLVRVRTLLEWNHSMRNPGSSAEATWLPDSAGDPDLRDRIVEMLKLRLARATLDQ